MILEECTVDTDVSYHALDGAILGHDRRRPPDFHSCIQAGIVSHSLLRSATGETTRMNLTASTQWLPSKTPAGQGPLVQHSLEHIPHVKRLSGAQGYGGQGILGYPDGQSRFFMEPFVKIPEECNTSGKNNPPVYKVRR